MELAQTIDFWAVNLGFHDPAHGISPLNDPQGRIQNQPLPDQHSAAIA